MLKVDTILAFFTLLLKLLAAREATMSRDAESATATINSLIAKREAAMQEHSRAQAAQKKLREFLV